MNTNRLRSLAIFLVFGCLAACPVRADESAITPTVAEKFGTIIDIEAEFVPKGNDYFSQNIMREPFYLKVLSVNGKAKQTPVVIQYSYQGKDHLAAGVKYRFKAYETIYAFGAVPHWSGRPEQVDYRILHQLVIKNAGEEQRQEKGK